VLIVNDLMSLHYWFFPQSDLCTCLSLLCCNFCLLAPTQRDFVPSGVQLLCQD